MGKRALKGVLINLDEEVWDRMKTAAAEEDRSASGLARIFLAQGLERYLSEREEHRAAA